MRAAQAVVARRAINFGKVCAVKVIHLSYRRKTKNIKSELGGFWRKNAMRKVGLAYRELIESLYESWTIGIERVYK